jgi:ketosteroid isomerase-like protein
MKRRNLFTKVATMLTSVVFALSLAHSASAADMDKESQQSFDTVMAFMGAMGKGDMETLVGLMADDMVWHNEGDKAMPWVGPWNGKEEILAFLPVFGENFQVTAWDNTDAFASGDTVAVFGKMNGITKKSGKEIGDFTFALKAKVKDGKVVLWNWFEDSFAVSNAFHGK